MWKRWGLTLRDRGMLTERDMHALTRSTMPWLIAGLEEFRDECARVAPPASRPFAITTRLRAAICRRWGHRWWQRVSDGALACETCKKESPANAND